MTPLDQAISLAQRGLPVFFCSRSKRPTLEGGFYNATANVDAIRLLYEKAPGDLIGVPCGHKFVVIDPDLQHRAAREWWKANKERIPITRAHRTVAGGLHFLFKPHPQFRTNITVHPHVDTRGLGSISSGGRRRVFRSSTRTSWPNARTGLLPPCRHPPSIGALRPVTPTPIDNYLAETTSPEATFAGILRQMASAQPGERQALSFWCANRTFELIRDGALHPDDAVAALEQVALSTGLQPRQVREVLRRVERTVLA